MKKITPAGIGLDLAGDAIEGSIAGAGSAIGGIAKGLGSAIGGVAEGAGKALGGALEGALREPDVYINSYGMAGAYAKENIKTTVRINTKNPVAVRVTEDMPLEKLMTVAIKYLSSISKNLRDQIAAENKIAERERLSQRENIIEQTQQDVTPITQENKGKKNMSNMTKALLAAGMLGFALPNMDLDLNSLKDLQKNIEQFKEDYGWMIELAGAAWLSHKIWKLRGFMSTFTKNVSRLLPPGLTSAPAMAAAATTVAGLYGIDSFIKSSANDALDPMKKMENKYGIKLEYDTSSGTIPVFKGATINGKMYAPGKLPKEYQEIYDSYSGARGSKSIDEIDKKYKNLQSPEGKSKYRPNDGAYNVEFALAFFKARGWSHEQAAGIVGNLMVESPGLNPHPKEGDGGRAYGVAQWHPDRQQKFKKVLGKDIRESTLEEQLHFVDYELKTSESAAGNMLRGASSPAQAAAIVDQKYERSSGAHRSQRIMNASAIAGGDYSSSNSNSNASGISGAVNAAGEMIQASLAQAVDIIKTIGKTDTQFRPLTAKTPTWDKARKIVEDQAKMDATMALGKKEEKQKQDSMINIPQANSLRNINGGSLDVIDPNYKSKGKDSILNNYILNFSSKAA